MIKTKSISCKKRPRRELRTINTDFENLDIPMIFDIFVDFWTVSNVCEFFWTTVGSYDTSTDHQPPPFFADILKFRRRQNRKTTNSKTWTSETFEFGPFTVFFQFVRSVPFSLFQNTQPTSFSLHSPKQLSVSDSGHTVRRRLFDTSKAGNS